MDTTIEARDRFQPKDRGCYVGNRNSTELPLKYLPSELYRYEMSNCLFEAAYEEILTKCGCAPSFHQLGAKSVNGTLCSGPGLTCMNGILRFIGKLNKVREFLPSFFLFCTGFCKGQSTFFETLMSPDSCNFSCGQFSLIWQKRFFFYSKLEYFSSLYFLSGKATHYKLDIGNHARATSNPIFVASTLPVFVSYR